MRDILASVKSVTGQDRVGRPNDRMDYRLKYILIDRIRHFNQSYGWYSLPCIIDLHFFPKICGEVNKTVKNIVRFFGGIDYNAYYDLSQLVRLTLNAQLLTNSSLPSWTTL